MELKVLVIQNNAINGNKKATLNNINKLLLPYSGQTFDLIVLPEVFSIGWNCSIFHKEAETIENSETISFLKDIARDYKSLVIGGSTILKRSVAHYTNTCATISQKGEIISLYDKMHLFSHKGSEENSYVKTGNELKLLNYKGTKIGVSICYDIRFPELYRCYSKNGAEILVNVAAWSKSKPEHWDIMHKARAIENQCYMIVSNQTGKINKDEINLGHSMVINPWGSVIKELQEEEGTLSITIDTDEVKKLRENFPLLKDRRDSMLDNFSCKEILIND